MVIFMAQEEYCDAAFGGEVFAPAWDLGNTNVFK